MADPNQEFVIARVTRKEIADYLESTAESHDLQPPYGQSLTEDDDRLTDAICERYAIKMDATDDLVYNQELHVGDVHEHIDDFLVGLLQELGYTTRPTTEIERQIYIESLQDRLLELRTETRKIQAELTELTAKIPGD